MSIGGLSRRIKISQLFTNNAVATLLTSLSNVATSMIISTGSEVLFPTIVSPSDYFLVTLEDEGLFEIVKVTATSSNTFTVVRAQEGTTARAWPAATPIELRLTAGTLEKIQADIGSSGVVDLGLGSTVDGNTIWHAGNDGTGSGLDADTVDGQHASAFATLASPVFTGNPTAPTPAVNDNDTSIATTAYVIGQKTATTPLMDGTATIGSETRWAAGNHVHPTDTTRAPLLSPTFTGTPAAPTAAADTNTTQLATTAFVLGQRGTASPLMNGVAAAGTSFRYSSQDHVHPSDTTKLDSSNYTASDVLTKIKTVDGAGSGLDADLLDGQQGSAYALLSGATFTGLVQLTGNISDQLYVRRGNGAASDGTAQEFAVLTGTGGSGSSGTFLGHYSNNASAVRTLRNAIRMYDTGLIFEDGAGASLITILNTGAVTFTGAITSSGAITANDGTLAVNNANGGGIYINTAAAGQSASLFYRTNGSTRWTWQKTSTAEAGSNAGSDLNLIAFNDAGSALFTSIGIKRSTGNVIIKGVATTDDGVNALQVTGSVSANGDLTLSSTSPSFYLKETDAAADSKLWRLVASGNQLILQTRDDANSTGTNALVISRTGTVVDSWTFAGKLIAPASTTTRASLNLAHGSAPTTPVNGDIWTTTSGVFARVNGSTIDLTSGSGAETDTLATVTGRGSTTSTACTFTNATASSSTGTGAVVITGGLGVGGQVTATTLVGNGSGITSLNMGNAGSGTLAVARGGTGVTTSTGSGSVVLSAGPTFTGVPVAPTANRGTNTTQLATTAFAKTESLQPSTGSDTTTTQIFPSSSNAGHEVSALSTAVTIENKNGTWVDLQGFVVRLKDNGTARAISFGTQYRAMGVTLPTTTVANKTMYISMIWNASDAKMDVVSVIKEA